MSSTSVEYLRHILDEADYLIRASHGVHPARFLGDETLKRAFVRSLEVIGEATKKLPEALRQRHSAVDWRAVARMRDRLIHGYFGVDYEIVWDVVVNKMPLLRDEVRRMLRAEGVDV